MNILKFPSALSLLYSHNFQCFIKYFEKSGKNLQYSNILLEKSGRMKNLLMKFCESKVIEDHV